MFVINRIPEAMILNIIKTLKGKVVVHRLQKKLLATKMLQFFTIILTNFEFRKENDLTTKCF